MTHANLGTRTANIKQAYKDLKDGYTIKCGELTVWVYEHPSTLKKCICYQYYGRWASTVNFRDFADNMRNYGKGKLDYDYYE